MKALAGAASHSIRMFEASFVTIPHAGRRTFRLTPSIRLASTLASTPSATTQNTRTRDVTALTTTTTTVVAAAEISYLSVLAKKSCGRPIAYGSGHAARNDVGARSVSTNASTHAGGTLGLPSVTASCASPNRE